jgi:type IV fimbrial biogenesis protein FimT
MLSNRVPAPLNQAEVAHGFTLVELMVTIAVAAILLSVAVPSFTDALLGSRLGAYANDIVASTLLARSEAIKRNVIVTVCTSGDGATCAGSGSWEQGWIVACKTSDNINCDPAGGNWLVFQRQQALASGIKITEAAAKIALDFQPTGVGSTQAALTVCRSMPTAGNQERVVTISATGRASVTKTTTGICS